MIRGHVALVQHFRRGVPDFAAALVRHQISIHPVVPGRVGYRQSRTPRGNAGRPAQIAACPHSTREECLAFVERHSLYGRGLGWNDVQLLVAARLTGQPLWSLDSRLAAAAIKLSVAYEGR